MVLTFFIVMFVLMMNIVWRYIDELVGKGLSAGIIIELMTYFMANMIPLGLPLAMLAGAAAGFITAFLQTKLAVPSILAGIITNTGLYTVNLAVMGFSSNVPMLKTKTVFTAAQGVFGESAPYKLIVAALVTVVVCALLIAFLGTRLGLSIRATGDNPDMVRASSINTAFTITVGLCIANAMTALSGAVLAQYQRSADINLGTGMVVIGLASLIIGETLFGRGGMWVKAVAASRAVSSTASLLRWLCVPTSRRSA